MLRLRRVISATTRYAHGGNLLKKEENIFPIIPLHNPHQRTSARFNDVYELATKAAIEQSRARVKDEISRGYLIQDMKDLVKHGGKVSKANKIIVPATSAVKFPKLEVKNTDDSSFKLPLTSEENSSNVSLTAKPNDTKVSASDTATASLVCLSFRANSQSMVESWSSPFLKAFANFSDVRLYEVSFIDSWLLSRFLIRKLLLKFMKKPTPAEKQDALKKQIVYSFGDHYYFRKELNIINLLTGYVFLLDKDGKIRWQGTGVATEEELLSLLTCTTILLEEN